MYGPLEVVPSTTVPGYCIIKYLYMLTIVLILDIYHSFIYTGFFSGGGGGGGGSVVKHA